MPGIELRGRMGQPGQQSCAFVNGRRRLSRCVNDLQSRSAVVARSLKVSILRRRR